MEVSEGGGDGKRRSMLNTKWMTWLPAALAVSFVSCVAPPVLAASEYKIGFVNTERILREAAPAVRAQKKLEKEFLTREQDLQKMAKQVRDLQTSLDRDGATMSETDRRNKERDLANLNRDFQRADRQFREDLNIRRNEETAGVQERAQRVIQQIADAEKLDLIVQEAVYISPRIDITDKVLKALADK
jgi:outer membrane protein